MTDDRQRIATALLAAVPVLSKTALDAIETQIERYRVDPRSELTIDVLGHLERNIRCLLEAILYDVSPDDLDLGFVEEAAVRRVRQGIGMDDFLHAFRVGHRVVWQAILDEAGDGPAGLRAALELALPAMNYIDRASTVIARTYLAERQRRLGDEQRRRRDLLEDLIAGRLPLADETLGFAKVCRLDAAPHLHVLVAVPNDTGGDALQVVADALTDELYRAATAFLVVPRYGELVAVIGTAGADPSALVDIIRRVAGAHIRAGLSTSCDSLGEIPRGYAEAQRALHLRTDETVVAMSGLSLLDYITSHLDVSVRHPIRPDLRAFLTEDLAGDSRLVDTLLAYLAADLSAARAAEALFVHPNTVHYRLGRIAERTGLDVHRFSDMVELLLAIRILHT